MASPRLKRNQQAIQLYGQGGVFGLSPPETTAPPRDSRKKRCSYREDRHCQASKLVQQVTHDDTPLYEVTYTHEHTCNAAHVPVPAVEVEDERPATASGGGLLLTFGSSGAGHRRNTQIRLKEEQQEYHHNPNPFLMMNLNHQNNNSQPHAIPSHRVPPPTTLSSSSQPFPIMESSSSPTLPWTDDEDDILTWDWDYSPAYDLDDHLQFGADHVQFPWKSDGGSALANLGMEMEGWRV
ncbi:hypothetical protein HU200_027471 [Digitaria exilis]|uniref:WRKY domain-containing protein n=1 Tax=Digitaria exilis TaxID=1010633 RepID=A0A835ETI0_9POAL|nr:hypothetical protein HU200_027471 [Digitaria exilis]